MRATRSKALLLRYITSGNVKNSIGELNAANILNFLRDHVFVHEDFFAACHYNMVRSFCDYSNTPLEGTNGGLKYGYFAVEPHMKISKSASYMITQDEVKHDIRRRTAYNNQFKAKVYEVHLSDSKETKNITPKALGEMRQQIRQADFYCSIRIDSSTWLVRNGRESADVLRLVPRFLRFRRVKKDNGRGFVCTCPFTSMYGIPCRHVAHVLQFYCTTPYTYSHRDVDVRWWTTYSNFVAIMEPSTMTQQQERIREQLLLIRRSVDVTVGKQADVANYIGPTYVHGNQTSESMKGISFEVARTNLFSDGLSHPTTYKQSDVELALAFLRNSHGGIKKTFELQCESDDDYGNSFQLYDDGNDDDDDYNDANDTFTNRCLTSEQEGRSKPANRYERLLSVNKELGSLIEDCDEEVFITVLKRAEDSVAQVRANIIHRQKKSNDPNEILCSVNPSLVTNRIRKHRRQQHYYKNIR